MKLIIIALWVLFSSHTLCQVELYELPYKISGNRTLTMPDNYFSKDMKGIAWVTLIIGSKCDLLNFAIDLIEVSDSAKNNIIKYHDNNIDKNIHENKIEIFNGNYYPAYIHNYYEELKTLLSGLKIEYDFKKIIKEINLIVVKIWIE